MGVFTGHDWKVPLSCASGQRVRGFRDLIMRRSFLACRVSCEHLPREQLGDRLWDPRG